MCLKNVLTVGIILVLVTKKVSSKYCNGGHYCTPPKECCSLGCCYLYPPPGPPTSTNLLNFFVWNHWFLWFLLLLLVLSCLGGCGIYRRRPLSLGCCCCCQLQRHDDSRSELDSVGSCYPPPHYSRCSSLHRAPPPYTEVTTKPDMYPLVISYNDDSNKYNRNYLMVQYFRNFIFRPNIASLPGTNTTDSITSSIFCPSDSGNDCCIPPSYEEQRHSCRSNGEIELQTIIRSSSNNSTIQRIRHATQDCMADNRRASFTVLPNQSLEEDDGEMVTQQPSTQTAQLSTFKAENHYEVPVTQADRRQTATNFLSTSTDSIIAIHDFPTAPSRPWSGRKHLHYYSTDIINSITRIMSLGDSMSSDDNLSNTRGSIQDFVSSEGLSQPSNHFSTSSDISSLQGCGTPNSPPQATSPTVELRDILEKIQKLPTETCLDQPSISAQTPDEDHATPTRPTILNVTRNFPVRSKTFYAPFCNKKGKNKIHFLSHSEPVTPMSNITSPNSLGLLFSKGSKKGLGNNDDSSPLLAEEANNEEMF